MSSIYNQMKAKIRSFLNDLPTPKGLPAYWMEHTIAYKVLLLSIVVLALFVAALPLILKAAGLSAFYFVIVIIAQLILGMLIFTLAMPPRPDNHCSIFISPVVTAISKFFTAPYTPPRFCATV